MGRKRVYGVTLMLMVFSSVASGLSFGKEAKGVMATLCFFRFWHGFGIGGDYPLSATIMSEYANKKTRGAFIAAVFAMQGFGILAGGAVTIIVSSAFKAKYPAPAYEVDPGLSTVPAADVFSFFQSRSNERESRCLLFFQPVKRKRETVKMKRRERRERRDIFFILLTGGNVYWSAPPQLYSLCLVLILMFSLSLFRGEISLKTQKKNSTCSSFMNY